jgi:hypothetical protein
MSAVATFKKHARNEEIQQKQLKQRVGNIQGLG